MDRISSQVSFCVARSHSVVPLESCSNYTHIRVQSRSSVWGFYISISVTEIKHLKCFCFNDSSGEESAMVARKCLVLKVKSYDVVLYFCFFFLPSIQMVPRDCIVQQLTLGIWNLKWQYFLPLLPGLVLKRWYSMAQIICLSIIQMFLNRLSHHAGNGSIYVICA